MAHKGPEEEACKYAHTRFCRTRFGAHPGKEGIRYLPRRIFWVSPPSSTANLAVPLGTLECMRPCQRAMIYANQRS